MKQPKQLDITFLIVADNVFLISSAKSTITIRNISVIRLLILMAPGFAVTDYKVQRAIFEQPYLTCKRSSFQIMETWKGNFALFISNYHPCKY